MNDIVGATHTGRPPLEPSARAILSLARRRVFSRLTKAVEYPILVMCAPPGFGKSTVLHEYFAATDRRYRRLHIAPGQGDLLGFMRAFANALGDLAPALLASFMGVYDRMHRAEEAAKEIAIWAGVHLELVQVTLMIDGLEHVTDERLFGLLSELIDRTSQTRIAWILVAENADRFPIARWLANDRMDLPIDELDLAITFDDLAAAVTITNAAISRSTLRHVCRTAANWPAAIALALSDLNALTIVASEPAEVVPYAHFAKRAFRARSETERNFLLETCLYKSFTLDLLELAGWADVEPMLERLHAAGAILFSEGNGAYRYQELFRSFLEERLRAGSDDVFRRVSIDSAVVCQRVGRWSDALQLYLDIQAAVPLAQMLTEHGFELLDRGEADSVYRALSALSETELAAYPVALALKASLESLHGSFDVAEAWFRHAIENVHDMRQRGSIVYRFATDLVRRDRHDAIDLLQPIVAEEGHELGLCVSLAGLLATAYASNHQRSQASQTIERALRQLVDVAEPTIRAKLYFQAGYVAFFAREPERAKNFAQQAVEVALGAHLFDIAARALSILYNVAVEHEDDVGAGRLYLDQIASCSVKAGSRELLVYATLGQFEIEVFRGDLLESARLDAALKLLELDYTIFASETLLPAQALRATWSGDFHRAYRLVAPTAEKQITPTRQLQRYAEIALYAAAAGLRSEATAAARRALWLLSTVDMTSNAMALTTTFLALALTMLGRHRRAALVIEQLGDCNNATPRLQQLICAITVVNDRSATGTYPANLRLTLDQLAAFDFGGISRLIEALPLPDTFRGQFEQLALPERELLVHLRAGLDAGEVADIRGQPLEAIETLIASLCRKLGCSSPRHAVALANSVDALSIRALTESLASA